MATVFMVCMNVVLAAAGGAPGTETWTSRDIGSITVPGSARYNPEANVWVVRGEGIDLWGPADTCQYVWQPFKGDGFIIARVESISGTHPWAKIGIMIRESMDAGSRFAAAYITQENGARFHARINTDDAVACDTSVATEEQTAVRAPAWVKLERRANQFYAYYATDKAGKAWRPMIWNPQTITMSRSACVGLVVCSHVAGVLCEARFSGVVVSDAGYEITEEDMLENPKEALVRAYQNLERLGNWRNDSEAIRKQGNLIASSLFAIARARELTGESAAAVLREYYRIVQLLPDSSFTSDALIRIAILDGEKGLNYARQRFETKSANDKDRFHAALMKNYCNRPGTPEGEAVLKIVLEYVATQSRFVLLEQAIAGLASDERGVSVCKGLIQCSMAQPSNVQIAVVALRYMALKAPRGQVDERMQELLNWVATQYQDTKLSPYAAAALADAQYEQAAYAKAIQTFRPDLLAAGEPEAKMVENLETALAAYRAHTLLQATINPERIYADLGAQATESGYHVVSLHCQRKIAEARGLSLESFEKAAPKGVKYCESGPENEVWFWKGLIAAGAGDLGSAVAAYERFLQTDAKSVLAARAYYDIGRTKMATGEDAGEWVAKAKALSPCDAVIQLERRLGTTASARR